MFSLYIQYNLKDRKYEYLKYPLRMHRAFFVYSNADNAYMCCTYWCTSLYVRWHKHKPLYTYKSNHVCGEVKFIASNAAKYLSFSNIISMPMLFFPLLFHCRPSQSLFSSTLPSSYPRYVLLFVLLFFKFFFSFPIHLDDSECFYILTHSRNASWLNRYTHRVYTFNATDPRFVNMDTRDC